jgi:type 1 fimbria pilin
LAPGDTALHRLSVPPINIVNDDPEGTVLWESPTETIELTCWVDEYHHPAENVHIYLNPLNFAHMTKDLQIEVFINGESYELTNSIEGFDTGWKIKGCKDVCSPDFDPNSKRAFTYSVVLRKGTPRGEEMSGSIFEGLDIAAALFQFDGEQGINGGGPAQFGKNNYRVELPVSNIKYLPCTSLISISPSVIDFGEISIQQDAVDEVIDEIPFNVLEHRTCTLPYAIEGMFWTTDGKLSEAKTLVPADNHSVGISIVDVKRNSALDFSRWFPLTETTSTVNNKREFLARLKWAAPHPVPGAFNAGAVLEIRYR